MSKLIEWYWALFHFWMRFPEQIRYILVGGYNSVVSYALYALFLWLLDKYQPALSFWMWSNPQLALFLSFLTSSVNSYWTQKIYVFATKGNYLKEYIRCLLSWGVGYLLNTAILEGLIRLGLNPYLAQGIALALVAVCSYLMLKYLAFQNHKKQEA